MRGSVGAYRYLALGFEGTYHGVFRLDGFPMPDPRAPNCKSTPAYFPRDGDDAHVPRPSNKREKIQKKILQNINCAQDPSDTDFLPSFSTFASTHVLVRRREIEERS